MTENCPATLGANETPLSYGFKLYAFDVFDWFLEGLAASAGLGIPFWEAFFLKPLLYAPLTTTCNQQGLAPLGDFLVNEMMHRGMIIDVDHMSIKALDRTLQLAEAKAYPGIVASHVLTFELASQPMRHERLRTRAQLNRIARLGGMIAVMTQAANRGCDIGEAYPCVDDHYGLPATTGVATECPGWSTTFAHMFEHAVDAMTVDGVKPPGIAFGTDFNGLSSHNRPRFGSLGCANQAASVPAPYPFTLEGFGTFNRQQTSDRVFDYNTDGLAHVGLLPDMVADLKKVGMSDAALAPLFGSAEAYLRMWELAGQSPLTIPAPSLNDSTAPETVAVVTPAPNAAGWNTAGVSVSLTATDAGVGVQQINHRLTHLQTVTDGQTAGALAEIVVAARPAELKYGARDLVGNLETIKTLKLKIDTIAPTISGSRAPAANVDGWNKTWT